MSDERRVRPPSSKGGSGAGGSSQDGAEVPARGAAGVRPEVEARLRALCASGDIHESTTVALRAYGPELFGFLLHGMGDEAVASDAFAQLSEDIWRGLPGFRWESSFRTWAYRLARHAAFHERERRRRDRKRAVPLSAFEGLEAIVAQVRTETLTFLQTESRSQLSRLRDELTEDERMLLTLRIDRGLAWPELAAIWEEGAEEIDLPRASARLRKRFQLLKGRIVRRARELGLVSDVPEAS